MLDIPRISQVFKVKLQTLQAPQGLIRLRSLD